eukprot:g12943.t1
MEYWQCLPAKTSMDCAGLGERCGGKGFYGPTECCLKSKSCVAKSKYYSICEYLMTPQLQCPSASEEKEEELQVCEEVQEHVEHVAEFLDVEPRPGPKALAVEDEVLREEAGIEASAKALRDVCVRFQLTLLENGENFEKTINNDSMDLFFGELGKTSSFASDSPLFQHPVVGSSNSCRWVELLNGSVLARLMSPDLTGLCLHRLMVPERFRVTQALLAALRRVTWAPEQLVGQL